ncbi:MAG TPA: hypothetical protein VNC59_01240 [Thermoanaerobaculia bacterium]|nr:hypothetical protein [Thermoanaerobaculia bacterium]
MGEALAMTEALKDLGAVEQRLRASLAKRKNPNPRDEDFLFARSLEDELRKRRPNY